MIVIERIGGKFHLKEGPIYIGQARDERHAKLWSLSEELEAIVPRLVALIPDTQMGLGCTVTSAEVTQARKLMELLK